jgi:hypothetical protein
MNKVILTLATLLAVGGSIAIADIMAPNESVVSGVEARHLNAKIAEITRQKPTEFGGRKVLTAKADVTCFEFSNGQVSCKVGILK